MPHMMQNDDLLPQASVVGIEVKPIEAHLNKEISEEPASSYEGDMSSVNEYDGGESGSDSNCDTNMSNLQDAEDDALHPLQKSANQAGYEIEEFAKALDILHPQKATNQFMRHEMMFDLLARFHSISLESAERMKQKYNSEKRKMEGQKWRKKMRGLKIAQSEEVAPEEMNNDDNTASFPSTTLQDLESSALEAQTWDLLKRLAATRFGPRPPPPKPARPPYSSEQEIWDNFTKTDDLAVERSVILQWLKDTADESGKDINVLVEGLQMNAERGDIIAHGWLHTKAAIKDYKRRMSSSCPLDPKNLNVKSGLLNLSKTEPLSCQLDPDVVGRQGRKLASQDEYFERAIWQGCYELLRRGKTPQEIKEWCIERTEIWRAVSMLGFSLENTSETKERANPNAIRRWRKACFAMARNEGGDEYEKAVYGILSGDILSVEPVCKSWDDFVFAHYNALLRAQFDDYLHKIFPQPSLTSTNATALRTFNAVQFHGESGSAGKRVIENLKSNPQTAEESLIPMKMLQGVIIANQFPNFIFQQGLALSKLANANELSRVIPPSKEQLEDGNISEYIQLDDHNSLRVLTHVLIIFMGLGLDLGDVYRETEVQNVIVAYVSFLRLAGKEELIPLYCSQLSGKRRYAILSRALIDVVDEEQRIIQINLMRELGLDVHEFVSLQARFLLEDFPDSTPGYPAKENFKLFIDSPDSLSPQRKLVKDFLGDEDSIMRIDSLLIRSLQWYLLVDGLWVETFRLGTMLYLRFYKHMHLCAAKILSIRVPSKLLMERKTRAILGESVNLFETDDFDVEDSNAALKFHMLAEANDFRSLEILIEFLDNIETATCLDDMKMQGLSSQIPSISRNDWRHNYQIACEDAKIYACHLMKGWLLSTPNECIQEELKLIREAYLPEALLAYVTVMQNAGLNLNREFLLVAMEVSSILADDDSDTLDLFVKTNRLQDMIDNLARVCKSLVISSSGEQKHASRTKRMKRRGWNIESWDVKPATRPEL
ncbi:Bgt-1967 [Blumeria graminis f. sp. tritici]|uniref:Nuclear pore complex protein n=2 Tax=Blumeria graminis f. sp. tritici TaxID=62690 RepID=A0A9X9ML39_BLUGR|nr:Subunit of the nuclear pore complex NPC [Blumeria graminis f. sp. tritici 96224]VDB92637.1 Bgt-1967 [Blumeria graminis f. sp. tritici]